MFTPMHNMMGLLIAMIVAVALTALRYAFVRLAPRWGGIRMLKVGDRLRRNDFFRMPAFALGISVPSEVGSRLKVVTANLPLAVASAGGRTSAAIDRNQTSTAGQVTMAKSAVLLVHLGVATGTPTSYTVDYKIQHSEASGSGFADYTDPNTGAVAAITQVAITGDGLGQVVELNVNLEGAGRYVRVVEAITIVGGSTPKVLAAASLVLGGFDGDPV